MSNGGDFQLLSRDPEHDKYLNAQNLLKRRLYKISNPKINDIKEYHFLPIDATYTPSINIASLYTKVQSSGNSHLIDGTNTLSFIPPNTGNFLSDVVLHIHFDAIGTKTDVITSDTILYRYCALPGLRILENAQFRNSSLVIDEVTTADAVLRHKFFTDPRHKVGRERCLGQNTLRHASYHANKYTGNFGYYDGHQTYKPYHEPLDLYIAIPFWFCGDIKDALHTDFIPNTQRNIQCTLAPLSNIIKAAHEDPNNFNSMIDVKLPFTKLGMQSNLYVNEIFVPPIINEIFSKNVKFGLIHTFKKQQVSVTANDTSIKLDQLKYPGEYLMVGVSDSTLKNNFDQWWMTGTNLARTTYDDILAPTMLYSEPTSSWTIVGRTCTQISELDNIVEELGLTFHGIPIYSTMNSKFYNAYLPTRYGKNAMCNSPNDTNTFLISMCILPGDRQHTGYSNFNDSRNIELNFTIKDTVTTPIDITVCMSALNFLIKNGDNLSLKFGL
jgi:hypothetical protein